MPRHAKELLDGLLLEGLDSGRPLSASPAFWDELKRDALDALLITRKRTVNTEGAARLTPAEAKKVRRRR
jgi:hypothetical protein